MDIEQRKNAINRKLEAIHETLVSWSKKNALDHKMVTNLIEGKLMGTRGVPSVAKNKIEAFFGKVFDQ